MMCAKSVDYVICECLYEYLRCGCVLMYNYMLGVWCMCVRCVNGLV